jgi:hypothetical protein
MFVLRIPDGLFRSRYGEAAECCTNCGLEFLARAAQQQGQRERATQGAKEDFAAAFHVFTIPVTGGPWQTASGELKTVTQSPGGRGVRGGRKHFIVPRYW